jgi:hypothetical protein
MLRLPERCVGPVSKWRSLIKWLLIEMVAAMWGSRHTVGICMRVLYVAKNKAQNTTRVCVFVCVCVCVFVWRLHSLKTYIFECHQMMIKTVFQDISALNPPWINKTCRCKHSYTCGPNYLLSVCLRALPVPHFTLHRMGKFFTFVPGKDNA